MKKIITFLALVYFIFIYAKPVLASEPVAESSAVLVNDYSSKSEDFKQKSNTLRAFLQKYDSPLAKYSDDFVSQAEKNAIDWRLVVAIAGVESTFGKNIPQGSYNAYGWANGNYAFKSWGESIEIVSQALKEKYIDKGADSVWEIAKIYAPPSTTWAARVNYFINKISPTELPFTI
jgi:hypothetical protein